MKVKVKLRKIGRNLDGIKLKVCDVGKKVICIEDHFAGNPGRRNSLIKKGTISEIDIIYDEIIDDVISEYFAVECSPDIRLKSKWCFLNNEDDLD
jgi:hypothetical protein